MNRIAQFLSAALACITLVSSAVAAPRYQITDLGPTGTAGYGAPNAMWRLTNNDETIVQKTYWTPSGSVALPGTVVAAGGPTEDGLVYVTIGRSTYWWHRDGRALVAAPANVTALSGNGWTARGEQFGSTPRLLSFAPLTVAPNVVYTAPSCNPANGDICSVTPTGIANSGDVVSSWHEYITQTEQETFQYLINSLALNVCDIGPMNDSGGFLYATCNLNTKSWTSSSHGNIPSPSDSAPYWKGLNAAGQVVGFAVTNQGPRGIMVYNGVLVNLDDTIPANSGYHIAAAYSVNDKGSVLAVAYLNGNSNAARAVLLTEAPLVVNTASDAEDLAIGDGACDTAVSPGDQCSLRAAIQEANASPGRSEIRFSIPAEGMPVIALGSELPYISETTVILGGTQPGSGEVAINGAGTGAIASGLTFLNEKNVASGLRIYNFGLSGVNLVGDGHSTLQDLVLGLKPDGSAGGFGGYGIAISDSSDNTVGGTGAGQANIIANAGMSGVSITGQSARNAVLSNSVFGNGTLGIDLGDDGATPNHGIGFSSGPNSFQNYPVLTSFVATGSAAIVAGVLTAEPLKRYTIQLFTSECSGARGQGESLLASGDFETTTSGEVPFQFVIPKSVGALTATATDIEGNTSEFSPILGTYDPSGTCMTTLQMKSKVSYWSNGKGKLSFQCPSPGTCKGTLKLMYKKPKKKSGPGRLSTTQLITVAKAAFQSKPSGTVAMTYTLNKAGQQIMQQGRGKMSTTAIVNTISQTGSRGASTFAVTIKRK